MAAIPRTKPLGLSDTAAPAGRRQAGPLPSIGSPSSDPPGGIDLQEESTTRSPRTCKTLTTYRTSITSIAPWRCPPPEPHNLQSSRSSNLGWTSFSGPTSLDKGQELLLLLPEELQKLRHIYLMTAANERLLVCACSGAWGRRGK